MAVLYLLHAEVWQSRHVAKTEESAQCLPTLLDPEKKAAVVT
jgi:hypothetical protein